MRPDLSRLRAKYQEEGGHLPPSSAASIKPVRSRAIRSVSSVSGVSGREPPSNEVEIIPYFKNIILPCVQKLIAIMIILFSAWMGFRGFPVMEEQAFLEKVLLCSASSLGWMLVFGFACLAIGVLISLLVVTLMHFVIFFVFVVTSALEIFRDFVR